MSHFSGELEHIKKDTGGTQGTIADAAGLTTSSISRYFNGERPDEDGLKALCTAFPNYSSRLLAAWVKDRIPSDLLPLVSILPADGKRWTASESETAIWEALSPKARKLLQAAARASREDPDFLKTLQSILKLRRK